MDSSILRVKFSFSSYLLGPRFRDLMAFLVLQGSFTLTRDVKHHRYTCAFESDDETCLTSIKELRLPNFKFDTIIYAN